MNLKIKFDEEGGAFTVLKGELSKIPNGWKEVSPGRYEPLWEECKHRRLSTIIKDGQPMVIPFCLLPKKNVTPEFCLACDLHEPETVQTTFKDIKLEERREEIRQANKPGTELKKILASWGIKDDKECGCQDHANTMDQLGVYWCKNNIETIVDWMMDSAKNKWWSKLLATRWITRRLILKAIRNCEVNLEQKTK